MIYIRKYGYNDQNFVITLVYMIGSCRVYTEGSGLIITVVVPKYCFLWSFGDKWCQENNLF